MTGEELKRQIALYESADHTVHLDVKVDEDTVWLNRQQLALLFGRDIKTIGKHVGNALREELNGGCGRFLGDSHAAIPWL